MTSSEVVGTKKKQKKMNITNALSRRGSNLTINRRQCSHNLIKESICECVYNGMTIHHRGVVTHIATDAYTI